MDHQRKIRADSQYSVKHMDTVYISCEDWEASA